MHPGSMEQRYDFLVIHQGVVDHMKNIYRSKFKDEWESKFKTGWLALKPSKYAAEIVVSVFASRALLARPQ